MVYYFDQSGLLNRVATVLEGLSEVMNANKLLEIAKRYSPITAIQRLGYLLEDFLDRKDLSILTKEHLKTVNHFSLLLKPQKERLNMVTGNDWKVVPKIEIEKDL